MASGAAPSGSGAPGLVVLVSAVAGWLSWGFLPTRQHPLPSTSAGTAACQSSRLLGSSGKAAAAAARDLRVPGGASLGDAGSSRARIAFFEAIAFYCN